MANKIDNGCGSIRQRSNGSWESRIMIDGKSKSFYAKTKAEAKRLLLKYSTSFKHEEDIITDEQSVPFQDDKSQSVSSPKTIAQWFEEWQHSWLTGITDNAKRRYDVDIRLHILPSIGTIQLNALTSSDVQRFYNTLQEQGLSVKSIRCVHGVLHSSLDKAVQLGLVKTNVTEACALPKLRLNEMHPIKDSTVPDFLRHISSSKYRDAYYVALFTGMREGEIMGLTWDCIDFTHNTIRIYRQLQRTHIEGKYDFSQTKNGKSRTIIPAKAVMDCLRTIKVRQEKESSNPASSWSNPEGFVFTTDKGHHLTINMLYKPFKQIVADMGIPETRFHDLRHSYAVLSLQSGCDIKTLSSNLGHSTIALTLDRYGHISDAMQRQSSEQMQALINDIWV